MAWVYYPPWLASVLFCPCFIHFLLSFGLLQSLLACFPFSFFLGFAFCVLLFAIPIFLGFIQLHLDFPFLAVYDETSTMCNRYKYCTEYNAMSTMCNTYKYCTLAVVPVLRTGCPTFLIHFQPVFSSLCSAMSQLWYLCASAPLILCLFNAWGVYSL